MFLMLRELEAMEPEERLSAVSAHMAVRELPEPSHLVRRPMSVEGVQASRRSTSVETGGAAKARPARVPYEVHRLRPGTQFEYGLDVGIVEGSAGELIAVNIEGRHLLLWPHTVVEVVR